MNADDLQRAQRTRIVDVAAQRRLVLRCVGRELIGACPHCGGKDRFAIHIEKNVFNCRGCGGRGDAISFVQWLNGVDFREAIEILTGERQEERRINIPAKKNDRQQHEKARWFWSQRLPITETIAERYLRDVRGIVCPLPPTLAFLAPTKPGRNPAMIAAFGLCEEPEPGIIAAPREVNAVHLTLLRADGGGKAEVDNPKFMIGSPGGLPIVVAPPNDLLGLAITEGIEDALSIHETTGLGAWAAGSAPHLPKLAASVLAWIDCCTIYADANPAGENNSALLAARLNARGIYAEVVQS